SFSVLSPQFSISSAQLFVSQFSILNSQSSILNSQSSILNPQSSILIALGCESCEPRPRLALDVVLLDLLVQVRPRRIDLLGGPGHVPAKLAQLDDDEGLLRLVLELLQFRELHRRSDDVGGRAEELRRQIGDVDGIGGDLDYQP